MNFILINILTNLILNHQGHRIVMNKVLTASSDKFSGLGIREGNESTLLEYIDPKQTVKNYLHPRSI